MKNCIFISFSLLISLSRVTLAGDNPLLFSNNGATNTNQAAFLNPAAAALGCGNEWGLAWSGTDSALNSSRGIWATHYQGKGHAEGFRFYQGPGPYQARFDLALADEGFWNLSPGVKLSYLTSAQDNDHALLDLGLNFRPLSQILLGYWIENMWSYGQESREQHFALEVQPFASMQQWPHDFLFGIKSTRTEDAYRHSAVYTQLPLGFGIRLQSSWDWKEREGSIGLLAQLTGTVQGGFGWFGNGTGTNQQHGREIAMTIRDDQRLPALVATGNTVILDLNQNIVEGQGGTNWLAGKNEIGFLELSNRLTVIEANPKIKSVLVYLGQAHCGWAMGEEIRNRLIRLKGQGKRVVVYMNQVSPLNYYLASAANVIAMQPQSYFAVTGFSTEVTFYRGLFDKLGVEPQFLRHGKYKSFEEPYMRTGFSEPARLNLSNYLESLWDHYLVEVSKSRGLSKDSLRKALESGEVSLSHARHAGLIDTLIQPDQALKLAGGKYVIVDPLDATKVYQGDVNGSPKIAVIVVTGEMVLGASTKGWLAGPELMGSETVTSQLRRARLDSRIKAVVLRVDSPGGSAQAADMMWREVELLKEAGKPVIASVGHDAASGGYYLICGADQIFAEPNSTVGSIGVLWGKFVLHGLYEKLGLKVETVKTSPHADGLSMQRAWDSSEVKVLQNHMDDFYQDFISKVAKGRHKTTATIDSLGQGQIFTGSQALANGLVDQIGGYEASLAEAAKRIGVKANGRYEIEVIEPEDINTGFTTLNRNWALSLQSLQHQIFGGLNTNHSTQGELEAKITPYLTKLTEHLKPGLYAISPEMAGWTSLP